MKFEQIYSSSMGNLYTVTAANGRRLLLDPGVTWARLQKALDYNLSNIEGALCTHEHLDHSKAVEQVMRAGIDVYSSAGTFEALGVTDNRRAKIVESYAGITSRNFDCYAFPLIHDAAEPFGFIVREVDTNEYLFFVPDSSYIKQRFALKFNIIAIECSYDIKILEHRVDTNDINEALAKRLLESHAEKQTTMKYLAEFCDLSRCQAIHLLHLSRGNIDAEKTRKEVEDKFFIKTVIV